MKNIYTVNPIRHQPGRSMSDNLAKPMAKGRLSATLVFTGGCCLAVFLLVLLWVAL